MFDPQSWEMSEHRKRGSFWKYTGSVLCCVVLQSHSLGPHGAQTATVHGDSPSKNPGVGGYALLWGNLPNPGIESWSPTLQVDS